MREAFDHQKKAISQYVEGQAAGESVEHVERMIQTRVLGREHEVWDVHTDADRYWVVTNLTNLYSHAEFRSADYALSFHLGLMLRMSERDQVERPEEMEGQVDVAWRKYEQAVEAFNSADEAEGFQGVGVRCREALIALARQIAADVPDDISARPKASDFKAWAKLGAERIADGRLRSYLVTIAEKSWDLAVWLQHYENATPWDSELVLDATVHTLSMFGIAMVRFERGPLSRCPQCSSYRVEGDGGVIDDDGSTQWRENVCGACEHRWGFERTHLVEGQGWVAFDDDGSHT